MGVSKKEISPCPIDVTLSVIDGRWEGTMLWRPLDGPMRTNELRKSIPEITERMLLRHLRIWQGLGFWNVIRNKACPCECGTR
jgi:DNA-binding HxlR family transcriptional regulator